MTAQQAANEIALLAKRQVGYCEGLNNYNKYAPVAEQAIGWLAQNQPWCGTFVVAMFVMTFGCDAACKILCGTVGGISAACRVNYDRFKAAGRLYDNPEVGDVVYFYYDNNVNHEGIVVNVTGSTIETIEGNSGDKVGPSTYYRSDTRIAGYGRPKYDLAETCIDTEEDTTEDDLGTADICSPLTKTYLHLEEGDGMNCPMARVMAWQAWLVVYECYDKSQPIQKFVDGEFGPNTRFYTEQLQELLGLPINGCVNEDEWKAVIQIDISETIEEKKVT